MNIIRRIGKLRLTIVALMIALGILAWMPKMRSDAANIWGFIAIFILNIVGYIWYKEDKIKDSAHKEGIGFLFGVLAFLILQYTSMTGNLVIPKTLAVGFAVIFLFEWVVSILAQRRAIRTMNDIMKKKKGA